MPPGRTMRSPLRLPPTPSIRVQLRNSSFACTRASNAWRFEDSQPLPIYLRANIHHIFPHLSLVHPGVLTSECSSGTTVVPCPKKHWGQVLSFIRTNRANGKVARWFHQCMVKTSKPRKPQHLDFL